MKYLLYQILLVIFVGLLIYALFSPYMGKEKEKAEKKELKELDALLTYLEKSREFYSGDYYIAHEDYQKLTNNVTINSTLELNKKGDNYYVYLKRDYISWKAIKGDKDVVCFSFGYDEKCAEVFNTSLENDFLSLSGSLPSPQWVDRMFISKYEKLAKFGGIKEIKESDSSYNGFECKKFEIIYSFKSLTVPELRTIGIDPNSPVIFVNEIKDTLCIGEDGKIVYKSTELEYNGNKANDHFLLLSSSIPKEIPSPNLTKPSEVERLKSIANMFFGEYRNCGDDDKCIRGVAIKYAMPSLCEVASNYTACLDAYSAFAKSDKGCQYFEEKSLPLPPICGGSLNNTVNSTNSSGGS